MENKTYSLTLNRLSKVIERVGTLRAEANQRVNELMVPVVVAPKDADNAMARLTDNNAELNKSIQKTNELIALQTYLRSVMMKENAKSGVTDLLMKIEETSQQSKFLDHLVSTLKGGATRLHHMQISQKDTPRMDDAGPLLNELKENSERVRAFLKDITSSSEGRDVLLAAKNLVGGVTLQNLIVSPFTKDEVKKMEESAKILHRRINSLHDELSALNASKVAVDLPVDVAIDLGLPA